MTTSTNHLDCGVHECPDCPPATPALERLKALQSHNTACAVPTTPTVIISRLRRGRRLRSKKRHMKMTSIPRAKATKALFNDLRAGLTAFPPYLPMPGVCEVDAEEGFTRIELVEGATCRLIMELEAQGKSDNQILYRVRLVCLDKQFRDRFSVNDVRQICANCRILGLNARMPLESDDWEVEKVQKWWRRDEQKKRDVPVTAEECGSTGWWTGVSQPFTLCNAILMESSSKMSRTGPGRDGHLLRSDQRNSRPTRTSNTTITPKRNAPADLITMTRSGHGIDHSAVRHTFHLDLATAITTVTR